MKQKIKDYIAITIGVIIAVSGLNLFLVPNKIAAGGISGIATILFHVFRIPLGLSIITLNIPLFVFGWKVVGKSFAIKTVYALLFYSLSAEVIPIPSSNQDMFLGCVYGGVLLGMGIGIVVKSGGSTGGTDMAAKMLSATLKSAGIGPFVFAIDFVVIAAAGFIFEPTAALYAIASLYISTKLIDFFTVGLSAAKAFYIITDKGDEIAGVIMKQMNRGVTSFIAKGLYSGKEKNVLLCVLKWRTEGAKLKKLVKSIDNHAFVIVADVKEVLGEGF
ncbi:MAG: YitT family protein [Christensenellales bacterium]|jgi:uncharacterized membrane-anchored protein YitT (DUF2179 family)